jgi:hypothetical protein
VGVGIDVEGERRKCGVEKTAKWWNPVEMQKGEG